MKIPQHREFWVVVGAVLGVACGDNIHVGVSADAQTPDTRSIDAMVDAAQPCVPSTASTLETLISGDLLIDTNQTEGSTTLVVPLDRTVLFTSLRENEPSPSHGAVMCQLRDADMTMMTPAGIVCDRTLTGTDNPASGGQIHVHWTAATFSAGVTVQRGVANTGFNDPSTIALTTVDPTATFVLLGGILTGGSGWGNNEFMREQLTGPNTLDLRTNVQGSQVAWQVVSMAGASVQRGTTPFASSDLMNSAALSPSVAAGSLVLSSNNTDNVSGIAAATMMLQAQTMGSSTLLLQRSLGGSILDVSWEVVTLPFAARQTTTSFDPGDTTKTETIASLPAASSVALASNQAILGQSGGSTSYMDTLLDLVGEGTVSLTTADGGVTLQRDTATSSASITWTVIDFSRDQCTIL